MCTEELSLRDVCMGTHVKRIKAWAPWLLAYRANWGGIAERLKE